LEIQKLWMRCAVRKPKDITVRKLVAIITKMKKSLTRFPGAKDSDEFDADELLKIIEWALPVRWRAKFDLDRYVPSLYGKARLIAEAEAIERSEAVLVKPTKAQETKEKKSSKSRAQKKVQAKNNKKVSTYYFCTEHGHNKTHATADCFTIKNRNDNGNHQNKTKNNRYFSTDKLRKEINFFSKGKNKAKLLNLYATEINNQCAQIKKNKPKSARKQPIEQDSTSEDEDGTKDPHNIDCPIEPEVSFRMPKQHKMRKVTSDEESSASVEEGAFRQKIANLGQVLDEDESTEESDDSMN
jgi:hypothetical protein